MIKKTIVTVGSGLLILGLLFGRDVVSYVRTSASWVHDSVRRQVPISFELERAREEIANLTPEVRRNMHLIAKEEIEVERLAQQIGQLELRQEKGRQTLLKLKAELDQGDSQLRLGRTIYTSAEAGKMVASRFERFKTDDQTLANLRRVLGARERGLEAARKQLDAMLTAKQQLLAEVAQLDARQKMNEVAQTTSDFAFDDSQLSRTRQLLRDIETRIQVDQRLMEAEMQYDTDDLLDDGPQTGTENVSADIASYFNMEPPVAAVAELTTDPQL